MQTGPRTVATATRGAPPSAATQQAPPPPTATLHPTCPTCRAQAGSCTTLLPWVRSLLHSSCALGQPATATATSSPYSVSTTLGLPQKTHCQCMKPRAGLSMRIAGGGLVQIFGLDSDCSEPDGTTSTSKQGVWLQVSSPSTPTWLPSMEGRVCHACAHMHAAGVAANSTHCSLDHSHKHPTTQGLLCLSAYSSACMCCLPVQPAR